MELKNKMQFFWMLSMARLYNFQTDVKSVLQSSEIILKENRTNFSLSVYLFL
jgi:hypothetical protein